MFLEVGRNEDEMFELQSLRTLLSCTLQHMYITSAAKNWIGREVKLQLKVWSTILVIWTIGLVIKHCQPIFFLNSKLCRNEGADHVWTVFFENISQNWVLFQYLKKPGQISPSFLTEHVSIESVFIETYFVVTMFSDTFSRETLSIDSIKTNHNF